MVVFIWVEAFHQRLRSGIVEKYFVCNFTRTYHASPNFLKARRLLEGIQRRRSKNQMNSLDTCIR